MNLPLKAHVQLKLLHLDGQTYINREVALHQYKEPSPYKLNRRTNIAQHSCTDDPIRDVAPVHVPNTQ